MDPFWHLKRCVSIEYIICYLYNFKNESTKKFIGRRISMSLNFVGWGLLDVSIIGRHRSTMSRMVEWFNETGSYSQRVGQGWQRCTNPRVERFIRPTALTNRKITSTRLKCELRTTRRHRVLSFRTIRRRLNEAGLSNRRPAKKKMLTREHRVARLRFARNYQHWTINDWKTVLFSNEPRVRSILLMGVNVFGEEQERDL